MQTLRGASLFTFPVEMTGAAIEKLLFGITDCAKMRPDQLIRHMY